MEIALSPSTKVALSSDAASIRIYAEGCESLPYVSYRGTPERAAFVAFLKHAKNAAVCLDVLSRFRGDVSFLLPAVKVEIRRALAGFEYIGHCVLAERVRGCILEAQARLEAIDEGVC